MGYARALVWVAAGLAMGCPARSVHPAMISLSAADSAPCLSSAPPGADAVAACASAVQRARTRDRATFWETRELPQQQRCWTPGRVAEVLRATCSRLADYLRRGDRSLYSSTCNDEQIFMRSTAVVQDGKRKQWQIGVTVIPTMTADPICKFSAVQVATFASVDQPDRSVTIELDRDSDELGRIIITAFGEER